MSSASGFGITRQSGTLAYTMHQFRWNKRTGQRRAPSGRAASGARASLLLGVSGNDSLPVSMINASIEDQAQTFRHTFQKLRSELSKVIVGQEEIIENVLVA